MKDAAYIDIFAGCGGLSLGFYNAGVRGLFAIEKDTMAFETLKYNLQINESHFLWPNWLPNEPNDINDIINNYSEKLMELRGKVSLVVGGPPCQGFSMAGKRESTDDRNKLVKSYLEFISLVQPDGIFIENVKGITMGFSDNEKAYSDFIVNKLSELGYKSLWKIINMSEYGVPQLRYRFILVAFKDIEPDVFFEKLKSNREAYFQEKGISQLNPVGEAIGDLLKENGEIQCPDTPSYTSGVYGKVTSGYQKLMRSGIKSDEVVDSHRFTKHTDRIIEMQKEMLKKCPRDKKIKPSDNLVTNLKRRSVTVLSEKGLAPTVTSIPDEMVHYKEPRILTVREMARIQGFPDWYHIKGKYTTGGSMRKKEVPRYTQIGNAIPPLFTEQVALVFKEML